MKISTTVVIALFGILMTGLPAEAQDDGIPFDFLPHRNWAPGDSIRMGIGAYLALFYRDSGWYVWKAGRPTRRPTCFAFKVSESGGWPAFSELGVLAGFGNAGYGFSEGLTYGSEHDWVGGFFGGFGYVKRQVAEVAGVATRDYDEREVVETWDGKKVLFEITTGPYEHLYVDNLDQQGVVDFGGLLDALEAFDRCHEAESGLTQSYTGRGYTDAAARTNMGASAFEIQIEEGPKYELTGTARFNRSEAHGKIEVCLRAVRPRKTRVMFVVLLDIEEMDESVNTTTQSASLTLEDPLTAFTVDDDQTFGITFESFEGGLLRGGFTGALDGIVFHPNGVDFSSRDAEVSGSFEAIEVKGRPVCSPPPPTW